MTEKAIICLQYELLGQLVSMSTYEYESGMNKKLMINLPALSQSQRSKFYRNTK